MIVVGAGVFGLAAAWGLARRGHRVTVLEAEVPGAGASGGLVGALAAYAPTPWTAEKAAQRRALDAAAAFWTEVDPGGWADYRVTGRLQPLGPGDRARAEAHAAASGGEILEWHPAVAPDAAPGGVLRDPGTAKLFPRGAVRAMAAASAARGVEIRRVRVTAVGDGWAEAAGRRWTGPVVLAAGAAAPRLLAPVLGRPLGRGVKGQAALLGAPGVPLVAGRGLYVVPHRAGVAVGSTSEAAWEAPGPDGQLDALIARAAALVPALAGAPVLERWAGVRPRAGTPQPLIDRVAPGLIVAHGAFKIGFGLAPLVAEAVPALAEGRDPGLPASWRLAAHLG